MSQGWGLFARRYVHTPIKPFGSPLFIPLGPNAVAEVEPHNPMSFTELSLLHRTWQLAPWKTPDSRLDFKTRYYRDRTRLALLDQDLAYATQERPDQLPKYYFELAKVHLALGDMDQAQASLDVVLKYTASYNHMYWQRQVAAKRALIAQCIDPQATYVKCREDYFESRGMFFGAHPSLVPKLMRMVCAAMAADQAVIAIDDVEGMLFDPQYFNCSEEKLWARSTLGVLYACEGSVRKAKDRFEVVAQASSPNSPQRLFAHLNLAGVLSSVQDLTGACAHLESSVVLADALTPDGPELVAFIQKWRQAMRSDEFHQTVTSTI